MTEAQPDLTRLGAVAETLPMTMISMGSIPAFHAIRKPDAPAVIFEDQELSWSELAQRSADRAAYLRSLEIGSGAVVVIALHNSFAFLESLFAVWAVGATPLPLSPVLAPQEQQALIDLAKPALVIDESIAITVQFSSGGSDGRDIPSTSAAGAWKIMASGGSTGRPKLIVAERPAVTDPEAYELFPIELHQGRLGRPNGVMLCPGPLYHNGPLVHALMNMFAGSTLVLMRRFDAEEALRQIARYRVEFAYLVPTMMHRIFMLSAETRARYDVSSLAGIVHTASACSADLKRWWIDWLGAERVWETYGSTEAVASTLINGEEWLKHPGSVGRFFFGAQGEARNADGLALPAGCVGELWVRARTEGLAFRYIGGEPREQDGWYSFGDLGSMDPEGYVYIADRRSDLIIRGGNNIYPAEVEAALEAHPDIIAAAVIGLPDRDLGACVHAIVQTRGVLDRAQIDALLRERLAPFKRPQTIEFVIDDLRDASGKMRRSALREERIAVLANSG